jgi:hypothetical protein
MSGSRDRLSFLVNSSRSVAVKPAAKPPPAPIPAPAAAAAAVALGVSSWLPLLLKPLVEALGAGE